MDKPLHIEEYLRYIGEHPDLKASTQFVCGARPGEKPTFFNTLPAGDVFIYPEFLAFLTQSKAPPGWRQALSTMWEEGGLKEYVHIYKWVHNPTSIATDIAKSINSYINPEPLEKALSNPNSFFIPLNEITNVGATRDWVQGNYIRIVTKQQNYILCQHLAEHPNLFRDIFKGRNPFKGFDPLWSFKGIYRHVSGRPSAQ